MMSFGPLPGGARTLTLVKALMKSLERVRTGIGISSGTSSGGRGSYRLTLKGSNSPTITIGPEHVRIWKKG